jgi:hypothetical protein
MEQRLDPRNLADCPAKLTILGDPDVTVEARVVDWSPNGLGLIVDQAVPLDALVRVDLDDTLLLGEVCYCHLVGAEYAVGLMLEEALWRVSEVQRLMRLVLGEDPAETPEQASPGCQRAKPVTPE